MRAGAGFRFPGGESLQEHSDRVWERLEEIRALAELPALVVCHRGSIRAVMCRSDPRGLDAFHEYDVPTRAGGAVRRSGCRPRVCRARRCDRRRLLRHPASEDPHAADPGRPASEPGRSTRSPVGSAGFRDPRTRLSTSTGSGTRSTCNTAQTSAGLRRQLRRPVRRDGRRQPIHGGQQRNPDGDFSLERPGGGRSRSLRARRAPTTSRSSLDQENRTFYQTETPFQLITTAPHPRVTGVAVTGRRSRASARRDLGPSPDGHHPLHAGDYLTAFIDVYRTDLGPAPRLVSASASRASAGVTAWDGRSAVRPPPPALISSACRSPIRPATSASFRWSCHPCRDRRPHRRDRAVSRRCRTADPGRRGPATVQVWSSGGAVPMAPARARHGRSNVSGHAVGGSRTRSTSA